MRSSYDEKPYENDGHVGFSSIYKYVKKYWSVIFFLSFFTILPLIYTNQLVLRGLIWHSEYFYSDSTYYSWAWVHIYGTSHSVMSMAWTCYIMSCEGTYGLGGIRTNRASIYISLKQKKVQRRMSRYCILPGNRTHDPWIARLAT